MPGGQRVEYAQGTKYTGPVPAVNLDRQATDPWQRVSCYGTAIKPTSKKLVPSTQFEIVTETAGEAVTRPQLERFVQRYLWAAEHCRGGATLEVACGTGPGLGHLARVSRMLVAGDYNATVLGVAFAQYGDRIPLLQFDAQALPFESSSLDTIILFEALYYLPNAAVFVEECHRVLRPSGKLLIATANPDLPDFNPSPFSTCYLNLPELTRLLGERGFHASCFGGSPVPQAGLATAFVRKLKTWAVRLGLIPRSMRGKRFLKRLVFGKLVRLPLEFRAEGASYDPPVPVDADSPNLNYQVLYCLAQKA